MYVEAKILLEVRQTPPGSLLNKIQPGNKIKVATHDQTFWLVVTRVADVIYCGEKKVKPNQILDVLITC